MSRIKDGNRVMKRELPKGIYEIDGKFRATVWDGNRKTYQVGTYATMEEAKASRNIAFIKQHLSDMKEYVTLVEGLISEVA